MAAIKINIKFPNAERFYQKLADATTGEKVIRPVVFGVIDMMTKRIHENGKKADGSLIGPYSPKYLKRRQRKPYNRNASETNIVFSLTTKLETDWNVIATERGYGAGFITARSRELVAILKAKHPGVFILSPDERKYASDNIKIQVKRELNEK